MENKLEQLLNSLIEKGWKPFGSYKDIITRYKYDNRFFDFNHEGDNMVSIRELVSKESGLWQFVCENRLLKGPDATDDWQKNGDYTGHYDELFYASQYQYYLIESALCDEDKLEEFILSNIKVEGK